MSTKIGLISDTHATTTPLKDALTLFEKKNVDTIICAGDIAGYGADQLEETVLLLKQSNCLSIAGNHDCWPLQGNPESSYDNSIEDFFKALPLKLELTIENKKIYVAHAQPPDLQHGGIKLLDPVGNIYPDRKEHWCNELKGLDADVLIVGHTHQVFSEYIGKVLVINPGSTVYNHSCCILTVPEMQATTYALGDKKIIKTWNWGMLYQQKPNL